MTSFKNEKPWQISDVLFFVCFFPHIHTLSNIYIYMGLCIWLSGLLCCKETHFAEASLFSLGSACGISLLLLVEIAFLRPEQRELTNDAKLLTGAKEEGGKPFIWFYMVF